MLVSVLELCNQLITDRPQIVELKRLVHLEVVDVAHLDRANPLLAALACSRRCVTCEKPLLAAHVFEDFTHLLLLDSALEVFDHFRVYLVELYGRLLLGLEKEEEEAHDLLVVRILDQLFFLVAVDYHRFERLGLFFVSYLE